MITNSHNGTKPVLPPLLKMRDVARVLSLSPPTVKALIESGDLNASEIKPTGKRKKRIHVRITTRSLAKFYEKRFDQKLEDALRNPSN
jgi:hypothetical protein